MLKALYKKTFLCILNLTAIFTLLAQNAPPLISAAVSSSYRQEALRVLPKAQKSLDDRLWDTAFSQSSLALAYDGTIADFYYIQALSLTAKSAAPFLIESLLLSALEEGKNWHSYNRDAARLLLAGLYAKLNQSQTALNLLNEKPVLSAAEALLIRAEAHYNLAQIQEARAAIEEGGLQYPYDESFPLLFFQAENQNNEAAQKRLARLFIERAGRLSQKNPDVLLFASKFSSGKAEKVRMLKEWKALGGLNPWYAVYALETAILTEGAALNYILPFFTKSISYDCLSAFVPLIKDEAVVQELSVFLKSYGGTISFDTNGDRIPDLQTSYKMGRPELIVYDENQDGQASWLINCDYGAPISISIPEKKLELWFGIWPSIVRAKDSLAGENNIVYDLLEDKLFWSPIRLIQDPLLVIKTGLVLHIPVLDAESGSFPYADLFNSSYIIEHKTDETEGSSVRLSLLHGRIKNTVYTEYGTPYAYGFFENGSLLFRNVDRDKNGTYELVEFYALDDKNSNIQQGAEERERLAAQLFGFAELGRKLYLQKLFIDENGDGIKEFSEEFSLDGQRISSWDRDGDGQQDSQFIKKSDGTEEVRYLHPVSKKIVAIHLEKGKPVLVNDRPITKDPAADFYWIGEYPGAGYTEKMLALLNHKPLQRVYVTVSERLWFSSGDRFIRILGVKNGDKYFGEIIYE